MADAEMLAACGRLIDVVQTLRGEHGCPWDKAQTPLSMRSYLIEEIFEVTDAITQQDAAHVREELGDALFNILLTAFMYEQSGAFSLADVFTDIAEKLVRRHPHVSFVHPEPAEAGGRGPSDGAVPRLADVQETWEGIKSRVEHRRKDSVLDEVPAGFPPLFKAYKYLKKVARQGVDWPNADCAKAKVLEELQEVESASSPQEREEELGDLLLSVANLARQYGVVPDVALSRANAKFYRRYTYVENRMRELGLPMDGGHLPQMEALWQEAKQKCLP